MSSEQETIKSNVQVVSPDGRGGPWLPVVLAAIGVGVLLSGIFSGATGLYGEIGELTFWDGLIESF